MESNLVLGSNKNLGKVGKNVWQNMAILGLEPNIVHRTWYKQEGKGVKVVQTGHPTGLLVEKGNIGVMLYPVV